MRSACSRSPGTATPPEPAGFGRLQVPLASITARASIDLTGLEPNLERLLIASLRAHLVEVLAADRDDPRVEADVRRDGGMLASGATIAIDQVVAGRQRVGSGGAASRRDSSSSRAAPIDHVAPRREHRDVPPLADRGAGFGAGLEHDEGLAIARSRCAAAARPTGPRANRSATGNS